MSVPPLTPSKTSTSGLEDPFLLLESLYNPAIRPPVLSNLELAPRRPPKVHHQRCGRPAKASPILATEEEIERRLQKRKLIVEWSDIRSRWKRRKYDLRDEPDVGQAIANSLAILASQELQHINTEVEPLADLAAPEQIDEDVDTTDDEHDTILQRLTQSSQISQSQQTNDTEDHNMPWADRLDFWQLGYQAPRLDQSYWKPPLDFILQPKGTERMRLPSPSRSEEIFTLGHFPHSQRRPPKRSLQYRRFPSCNQEASGLFLHSRYAAVVAVRFLSGATSCDRRNISNRLLRILWDKEVLRTGRSVQMEIITRSQGQSLRFFYRHVWRDPFQVARLLGLTPNLLLLGPQSMADEPLMYGHMRQRYLTLHDRILHEFVTKNTSFIPWDHASSEIQSTPGVNFVPVPGAVPPTPMFPLDASGILLGPMDKYHYAERTREAVDEGTYRLTLSTLLSRLAEAHVSGVHHTETQLKRQIMLLAKAVLHANQNKLYKRLAKTKRRVSELPLSSFAKASELFCSLVANGCLQWPLQGLEAEVADDLDQDAKEDSFSTIDGTLRELSSHNGLQLFSSLHITLGLMELSRALPTCARNILARPMDGQSCRTPLEVVRQVLEYLEESHLLVEASSFHASEHIVVVEELEFAFHRAGESFTKSLERDPTEIDHHSWMLAALAGSLLLSSGNRIEPLAAQRHASYLLHQHVLLNSFQSKSKLTGNHEVRRRFSKFPSLRVETIQAFQRMTQLANHQETAARVHLAIASFLEWKQVVALLLGPRAEESDFCKVRTRHRFHATQWAVHQNPPSIGGYLRSLHKRCGWEDRMSYVAALLEANPATRDNWVSFARELGSFGSPTPKNQQMRCTCLECQHLLPSCTMNHDKQRRLRNWWQESRFSWWDQSLLHLSRPDEETNDLQGLDDALSNHLNEFSVTLAADAIVTDDHADLNGSPLFRMEELKETKLSSSKTPSVEERVENCCNKLPDSFQVTRGHEPLQDPVIPDDFPPEIDALLFKVYIRGHFYGLVDDMFMSGVAQLAKKSWDTNCSQLALNSPAFQALHWLSSMGLNVAATNVAFKRAGLLLKPSAHHIQKPCS